MKRSQKRQKSHMVQKLKQLLLSTLMIATFIIYAVHERFSGKDILPLTENISSNDNVATFVPELTPTTSQFIQALTSVPSISQPTPATTVSKYMDGQYTGQTASAYYGMVQVEIVIQDGSITDVQFVDSPRHSRTSVRINSIAMPYLTREAIQAQAARVNIISGATLTSRAFMQSLNSALIQAERSL